MKRILFPVLGVRELVEFAWRDLERRYGDTRDNLQVWPDLVFHGGREIGIVLFPFVEDRIRMPVLYALGCEPCRDVDWRGNVERLLGGEEWVFEAGLECLLEGLEMGAGFFEVWFEEGEVRIDWRSDSTKGSWL